MKKKESQTLGNYFDKEKDFEDAVVTELHTKCGWDGGENIPAIIENPTEKKLIQNWANILFANNCEKLILNGCPLTESEMKQIMTQVEQIKSSCDINALINGGIFEDGGLISITRDNKEDEINYGKTVYLKLFNKTHISSGTSVYQIVRQPKFRAKDPLLKDRRGDLLLLINGMPLIHIELKKSNVGVDQAIDQIYKYSYEGVFTGLFSFVQIFVAMNPNETVYFANNNFSKDKGIDRDYCFHWADFNNQKINNWREICEKLLSIPMAHELIAYYSIPDVSTKDKTLMLMRSYQFYATQAILKKLSQINDYHTEKGGYIWHTTGSGKTLTSFKAAQLITSGLISNKVQKVVFLMDRLELIDQSLAQYRNFASLGLEDHQKNETIQSTENTAVLIKKLRSNALKDRLIVTSIQKMSNIKKVFDEKSKNNIKDIKEIQNKCIVIIVDECHRDVFGEMYASIRDTFTNAIFFGFTGTPIMKENELNNCTTVDVFGDRLHRYTIVDAINDHNVLGFEQFRYATLTDQETRDFVIKQKTKVDNLNELYSLPEKSEKKEIFTKYSNLDLADVEKELDNRVYNNDDHRNKVIEGIYKNWNSRTFNGQYHAILATTSIMEAISYYKLFKQYAQKLKADSNSKLAPLYVTAMFDPYIEENKDQGDVFVAKEEGLKEIIEDYNKTYNTKFSMKTFDAMKNDIRLRFAHKDQYKDLETNRKRLQDLKNADGDQIKRINLEYDYLKGREQSLQPIDLLIVVDQMLTGYDSKWINTIYLDKMLEYHHLVQAMSRTNRLNGREKQHGIVVYCRRPHLMERNALEAVKLYSSSNDHSAIFKDHLPTTIRSLNAKFGEIKSLFKMFGSENFESIPTESSDCKKFLSLFNEFKQLLATATVQGFNWDKLNYPSDIYDQTDDFQVQSPEKKYVHVDFTRDDYEKLLQRQHDLASSKNSKDQQAIVHDPFYDLDYQFSSFETQKIDADYLNKSIVSLAKALDSDDDQSEYIEQLKQNIHMSFAKLPANDQVYARLFLNDLENKKIKVNLDLTLIDYINQYRERDLLNHVTLLVDELGVDRTMLIDLIKENPTDKSLAKEHYTSFDTLKKSIDRNLAITYFSKRGQTDLNGTLACIQASKLLKNFVLTKMLSQ